MNTIRLWMIATGVAISVITSVAASTDGGSSDTRSTFKAYYQDAGCSLLSLASTFPLLYPNKSDITRPGAPGAFDADMYLNTSTFRLAINLTFNAPVIGNFSSFKGFEIMNHRSDNPNISCWIYDLSNINFTAANITTLFNLAVQPAKKNSTYFFEISTLPKSAVLSEHSEKLTMNVFVLNSTAGTDASNWTTYVKFINDSQKKEVWVEFTEPPASFGFSEFEVKLFPRDKDGEQQKAIISGVNHTFCDVKPGLYTITIKPRDFFENLVLCKCCTNSIYQQCTTSETTPFYIHKVEQISTSSQLSSTATMMTSTLSRLVSTVSSSDMFQSSSRNIPTTIQKSTTPSIITNSISVGFHRTTLTVSFDRTLVSNGTLSESTTSSSYHGISTKINISSAVPSNQGDMTFTYVIIGCASGVILAVLVVTVHCLRNGRRQDLKEPKPDPSKKENKMYQGNNVDDDLNSIVMLDAIWTIKSSKTLKEYTNPLSRKNVFLVFAEDHDDHITAVDLFASFLQSHCFCDVVYAPYHVESLQKDGLITRMKYSLEKADCILIINSAALYNIYNTEKCRKKLRSRSDSFFANILLITIKFVMSKLAENPTCRIANLRFEHTPNEFVVLNLLENFLLLKQFKELLYYIHEIKEIEDTNNFEHLEIGTLLKTDNWQFLCNAIRNAWSFEQNNPSWLSQRFCTEECDFIGHKEVILKGCSNCLSDTTLDVKDRQFDLQTRLTRMIGTDLSSPEDSSVKNPNGFYYNVNKTDSSLLNTYIQMYAPSDIEEDKQSKTFSEQMTSINEHYSRRQCLCHGNTIRTSWGKEEVKENRKWTPIDNFCALREANSPSPDDFIPPDDYFQEDVVSNGRENHTGIISSGFQENLSGYSEIHDMKDKEWRQIEDDNVSLGGYSV
ncbi:hypothetical protein CHS0354_004961 [Potamilus streckersoni]|uniref:SEFIR domain-containing protein n=1 Tax=Potamilus streckersoni TaxID=2493646 RepID=A0AAE0VFY0_9BIVA|nr:hypothetical protein CHS0354_004961 [Potamilus streckersoni]